MTVNNEAFKDEAGALAKILQLVAGLDEGRPASEGGRGSWLNEASSRRFVQGHMKDGVKASPGDGGVSYVWEKLLATAKWRERERIESLPSEFGGSRAEQLASKYWRSGPIVHA
jgi:hypothetical protein